MATGEIQGALVLTLLFAGLMAATEVWARVARPPPEWPRKLIHFGGGIGCLAFPLLVSSPWTVVAMGGLFGGILWGGERAGLLTSLGGVKRVGKGSLYYPLAIAFLFWVAGERYWFYLIAVLILTVSDTGAALFGSSYGRLRYRISETESKSVEGSAIFWLLTFLIVEIPLLLLTPLERGVCILSAFIVATLLTATEAVASRGRDNILVPVLCSYLLLKVTTKPATELAYQALSVSGIFAALFLFNRRAKLFDTGGAVVTLLFVYAAWSLGSRDWAIPLLVALALYHLVCRFSGAGQPEAQGSAGVLLLFLPMAVSLLLANHLDAYGFYYGPFLAMVCATAGGSLAWAGKRAGTAVASTGAGALVVSAAAAGSAMAWQGVFLPANGAFLLATGLAGYALIRFLPEGFRQHASTRSAIALCSALAGAACVGLQNAGLFGPWNLSYL